MVSSKGTGGQHARRGQRQKHQEIQSSQYDIRIPRGVDEFNSADACRYDVPGPKFDDGAPQVSWDPEGDPRMCYSSRVLEGAGH